MYSESTLIAKEVTKFIYVTVNSVNLIITFTGLIQPFVYV